MSVFLDYPDRETLMSGLATMVANQLQSVLDEKGWAVLAVPGGTTPAPFLERLSNKQIDWQHVTILLTDERIQPADPFRSNYRMIKHYLDQNYSSTAQIIPMAGIEQPATQAIKDALESYAVHLPIDILVLGMGGDMHTASLFPDAIQLAQALSDDAPPVMLIDSATQPEMRITLTAPALKQAGYVHVLITGSEKLAAIQHAQKEGTTEMIAPIKSVLSGPIMATVHHSL